MMHSTTEITLRAMQFHTLVGILPHEKTVPQPLDIDLTVLIGQGESVVDYRRLYDTTAAVLAAGHIDYLEDIAERIAAAILKASDRAMSVAVAVRKPHVALGGPLTHAEVRIVRIRPVTGV